MSVASPGFLPYAKPTLHPDDVRAVLEVLSGDFWTTGPFVRKFEESIASACGSTHAVAVANGTAALHLALAAAGIGPGSLVIVPDITFVATAHAVKYVCGDVLICDVDPATGLMTPDSLAAAVARADRRVACVMPVHLAGQTVDIGALAKVLASDRRTESTIIVEDASHAIGSHYPNGTPVGGSPDSTMATFSFHPVKSVATGEGGAITTSDPELARRLASLRAHGINRDPAQFQSKENGFAPDGTPNFWYYEAQEVGYNYRLSDIHAALADSQLGRLVELRERRALLVNTYRSRLEPLSPIVTCLQRAHEGAACWHLMVVHIDFAKAGLDRNSLGASLRARGIGTQVHYIPLHHQPTLANSARAESLEGAESYYAHCLSLPLYAGMDEADVIRVCDALADVISDASRQL